MTKANKSVMVNFRIDEDLKNQLQKLADKDRRTLSDYIRVQLENIVKAEKR